VGVLSYSELLLAVYHATPGITALGIIGAAFCAAHLTDSCTDCIVLAVVDGLYVLSTNSNKFFICVLGLFR
jgi:hypothetical protein